MSLRKIVLGTVLAGIILWFLYPVFLPFIPEIDAEISSSSTSHSNNPVLNEEMRITNASSFKSIYSVGEEGNVNFCIENGLKIPFNFTVFWYDAENTKHFGWFYETNETIVQSYCPTSWYQLLSTGQWKAQIVLSYFDSRPYFNKTFEKDEIIEFEVK